MARYAFTDLHGLYDLWAQIRDYCKPDDELYFLGDAIDRGTRGVDIMIELFKDPRVTYILGNHEDFLIQHKDYFYGEERYEEMYLWIMNGGMTTIEGVEKLSPETRDWLFNKLIHEAEQYVELYIAGEDERIEKTIYMSHSGSIHKMVKQDLYWDRKHFFEPMKHTWYNYIVHGHTPVQALIPKLNSLLPLDHQLPIQDEPLHYAMGQKIDLDMYSYGTYKAALFNLDTMKTEKIFEVRADDEERKLVE